jgi:hypothetical protein
MAYLSSESAVSIAFVAAEAHAHVRFRRAIEHRALWMAEDAARDLPNLPLEDALQLVHLYAERGSPKYEKEHSAMPQCAGMSFEARCRSDQRNPGRYTLRSA